MQHLILQPINLEIFQPAKVKLQRMTHYLSDRNRQHQHVSSNRQNVHCAVYIINNKYNINTKFTLTTNTVLYA